MNEQVGPVLVASDLQASSRPVVELAGKLARAADTRLILLHVIEPDSASHVPRPDREAHLEGKRTHCERALQFQADELEEAGTRVRTGLAVNRPAHEAILERVTDTGAGILVAGSAAREGRGHRLGSTADRLLRSSPVPCLIVRGRVDFPVTKAAAATDFSDHSRRAVEVAAPWLEALGEGSARLDLVHVADRSSISHDPSLEDWFENQLAQEAGRLDGTSEAPRPGTRLCVGDHPVDAIVTLAEEEGYQLLIAGTHGHGPVRRALIGSVAMGLAQGAPCPVLVVPPKASG